MRSFVWQFQKSLQGTGQWRPGAFQTRAGQLPTASLHLLVRTSTRFSCRQTSCSSPWLLLTTPNCSSATTFSHTTTTKREERDHKKKKKGKRCSLTTQESHLHSKLARDRHQQRHIVWAHSQLHVETQMSTETFSSSVRGYRTMINGNPSDQMPNGDIGYLGALTSRLSSLSPGHWRVC